jgi:hypothetical protein
MAMSSAAIADDTPRWYRLLQDLKALVWPTAIAIVTALIHFLGAALLTGRARALSIPFINGSAGGEIYLGAAFLLMLATPVAGLVLIGAAAWRLLKFVARPIERRFPTFASRAFTLWQGAVAHPLTKWAVLFVMFLSAVVVGAFLLDLLDKSDGLILKRASETRGSWLNIQLDDEGGWFPAIYCDLRDLAGLVSLDQPLACQGVRSPCNDKEFAFFVIYGYSVQNAGSQSFTCRVRRSNR